MNERPRLADVLAQQQAEAEREAERQRLEREVELLDRQLVDYDAEREAERSRRPQAERIEDFKRRTAAQAQAEQLQEERERRELHANPDPPTWDPLVELLQQRADRKRRMRATLVRSAGRTGAWS